MRSTAYCLLFLSQLSLLLAGPPIDFKCLIHDSSCLTAKVQALSAFVSTGIPQLGIEKLDPITDSVHVDDGELKFDMQKMHVQGMKNVVIDNVSIDAISRVIRILFHTDFLFNGGYVTSGTLLSLPFYGEGDYRKRLDDVLTNMVIPFDVIKDANGRNIIDIKSFQYTYDVRGGAFFDLGNLYYGDKHSSDLMHQFLHQNWKLITRKYERYFFDKVNDKIFNALQSYLCSNSSTINFY